MQEVHIKSNAKNEVEVDTNITDTSELMFALIGALTMYAKDLEITEDTVINMLRHIWGYEQAKEEDNENH